jgi:hypothetical protein
VRTLARSTVLLACLAPAVAHAQPAPTAAPAAQAAPDAQAATPAPAAQPAETAPAALPPPPGAAPSATAQSPAPAPEAEGPRTAVIDAAPIGVDPAAASYITELLRTTVRSLGFRVIPTQELYQAAQRLALPFPVPPDGVYLLERALQAPVAVTAEVSASGGQYTVRLRVRVAVEPTERVRAVTADQYQLTDQVRAALPSLLSPPDLSALPPPRDLDAVTPEPPPPPVPRVRRIRAHPRRWELGGGLLMALGPGRDDFVNALVMTRVGYFPQDRFGVTASLGYANLRGRDQRVSNVLLLAGVETAVDLVPRSRVFIPLRAEVGYLPGNGPVFRLTAGVMFQLARRVRLEVDLLSPTLWVLPETTPVSLDLGATLHFGL